MKRSLLITLSLGLAGVFFAGCEWESTGDAGSWNDAHSWINFGGTYRSTTENRALVENFSASSSYGSVSGSTGSSSEDVEYKEHSYNDVVGAVQGSPFTMFSGTINFENRGKEGWFLKRGSITLVITGQATGPQGAFTDNSNGGLSGSYSQVPGGPTFTGTGTINYDTGAWTITLDGSNTFIEDAQITYSYIVREKLDDTGPSDDDDVDPPTDSGWIYSLQVEQTGNRLRFVDNNGSVYEGSVSTVTTPGGDSSGRSSGEVVMNFEVNGNSGSSPVQIVGAFRGVYTSASAGSDSGSQDTQEPYGRLAERVIQGTWIEPSGQGDLYGSAGDI